MDAGSMKILKCWCVCAQETMATESSVRVGARNQTIRHLKRFAVCLKEAVTIAVTMAEKKIANTTVTILSPPENDKPMEQASDENTTEKRIAKPNDAKNTAIGFRTGFGS
jgi:hypothetical protein